MEEDTYFDALNRSSGRARLQIPVVSFNRACGAELETIDRDRTESLTPDKPLRLRLERSRKARTVCPGGSVWFA
jgi:hypothetical protein